jgi:serine/threonine protein kinase
LLDTNGYIKLTDFGAAKYAYQTKKYKTFIGTLDFIAPEVLRRQPYTKAVDWWSLGVLVYQLLFGELPFYDKNPKIVVNKILKEDPTFPETPAISEPCKNFILWCLQKDPAARTGDANAETLLYELEWLSKDGDKPLGAEYYQQVLNYSVNAPMLPEMPADQEDDEEDEEEDNCPSPRLSVLEEGILEDIQKFDPMFKGFYLDQLNTPATHTPVTLTPPPERTKTGCSAWDGKDSLSNVPDHEMLSTKAKSRADSKSNSELASVTVKRSILTNNGQEAPENPESPFQGPSHPDGETRDLKIDTNILDDDASNVGLTSGLASPPNGALSIGSLQERGINSFNFELLSTPLLLEKEASLRLTTVINNLDDADTYGDSNPIGSLCPTKKLAELMASEGGDDDKVVNLNVKVTTEQEIGGGSEENDINGDREDENYPFSRKSELLDNKQRMMEKHENPTNPTNPTIPTNPTYPSNFKNPIKVNVEDIEIEQGSGENWEKFAGEAWSGRKTGASIGTPTVVKPRRSVLDGDTPLKGLASLGKDGVMSESNIQTEKCQK